MKIANASFSSDSFLPDDLFVCAVGYETRSFHLLSKAIKSITLDNILAFKFPDLINARENGEMPEELLSACAKIDFVEASYETQEFAVKTILNFIKQKKSSKPIRIHIDYSSMPRGWYCVLPQSISKELRPTDLVFFWYVDGEYPDSYVNYPSAGIHSFAYFSGKPSLRTNKKRLHIISLSYDVIRTQATISLLDPDAFIACVAYDSRNSIIHDNVLKINHAVISHSDMLVSLRMDDFEFMVAKLREIANEYVAEWDVIFVPDGPKPLIFAESLIPIILKEKGVSCLHIKRNKKYFNPVEVLPTENVIGFVVTYG